MPKYEIVPETKNKKQNTVKLDEKGQERVWRIQSASELFEMTSDLTNSRKPCFHKTTIS